MARKHVIQGFKALDAADATSVQISAETVIDQTDKLSYHVKFSAANSGTFEVQVRNGEKNDWYALNFGTPLTITAETEVQLLVNECPFTHVRLQWTPSAGSGTLTAAITTKSVGA